MRGMRSAIASSAGPWLRGMTLGAAAFAVGGCATSGIVDRSAGAFELLEPVLLDVGPVTATVEISEAAYVAVFEIYENGGVALVHPSSPEVEMDAQGDFISYEPAPRLEAGTHVLTNRAGWFAPSPSNLRRSQVLGPVRPAFFILASQEPLRLERLVRIQEYPRDYLVGESTRIMEEVSRLVVPRAVDIMDRSWAASLRYSGM